MSVSGSVLLLYAGAHKISLKYLSRKNVHRNMLSKMPEMLHNLCDNLFLLNFKGLSKKIIEYVHQNLRYYETIEQIHLMVVKK
jgi:hypothetical protein